MAITLAPPTASPLKGAIPAAWQSRFCGIPLKDSRRPAPDAHGPVPEKMKP